MELNDGLRTNISFYARNIMESVATALLCRLDPYRVMVTYQVQSSPQYDVTKKSNVAIQWNGDIIANKKSKNDLWKPDYKLETYDRALLSNHSGELFWKIGFLNTMDFLEESELVSEWISRLKQFDENQFFQMIKRSTGRLFSAFSKGVHYEFLVSEESVLDSATIETYVNEMFFVLASMSLVGHFMCLEKVVIEDKQNAVQSFMCIEEELFHGNDR